jgi:hypothetical protein
MKKIFFIAAIVICVATITYAQMYFWVDENGVKHFSNTEISTAAPEVQTLYESRGVSVDVFKENAATYSHSKPRHSDREMQNTQLNRNIEREKINDEIKKKEAELESLARDFDVNFRNPDRMSRQAVQIAEKKGEINRLQNQINPPSPEQRLERRTRDLEFELQQQKQDMTWHKLFDK